MFIITFCNLKPTVSWYLLGIADTASKPPENIFCTGFFFGSNLLVYLGQAGIRQYIEYYFFVYITSDLALCYLYQLVWLKYRKQNVCSGHVPLE